MALDVLPSPRRTAPLLQAQTSSKHTFRLAMLRSTFSKALPARSFSTSSSAQHGIKSVGIVGTGQMGLGIGYVAAKVAGVPVVFMDKSEQQITKGFAFIGPSSPSSRSTFAHSYVLGPDKLLAKDVGRGKMTQDESDAIRSRMSSVSTLEAFGSVDLAIEAVSEHLPLKQKIFADLATYLPSHAILASNTSSISLTTIAAAAIPAGSKDLTASLPYASRVVGFHFFNPVPVMKLGELRARERESGLTKWITVELIPALQTDPAVS
jgi:3-hydroxybutyryl-CoA dehydrogenase